MERQENYTIWEGHEIPSKGLIYEEIYGKRVEPNIELRAMTTREELKRLAPSNTQFKVLCDIIEGCMIEKPAIHVYDMALGDYEFLLHKLRVVTYGSEYKMTVACPICGAVTDVVTDLDQLRIKDFDIETFNELRTVVLPDSGDTVTFRIQTPRLLDELEAKSKEARRKYKEATIDFAFFYKLTHSIDSLNGNKMDPLKAESVINKMTAKDMMKLLNAYEQLNNYIGLDTSLIVDCGNEDCGEEFTTYFRFGQEFFRPTTI